MLERCCLTNFPYTGRLLVQTHSIYSTSREEIELQEGLAIQKLRKEILPEPADPIGFEKNKTSTTCYSRSGDNFSTAVPEHVVQTQPVVNLQAQPHIPPFWERDDILPPSEQDGGAIFRLPSRRGAPASASLETTSFLQDDSQCDYLISPLNSAINTSASFFRPSTERRRPSGNSMDMSTEQSFASSSVATLLSPTGRGG